jgi:capsular polysaccharide biosynthesis protein
MLSTLSETKQMTYKELLNQLQSLTEEQLNSVVSICSVDDDPDEYGYIQNGVELVFATDAQSVLDVDHPIIRF